MKLTYHAFSTATNVDLEADLSSGKITLGVDSGDYYGASIELKSLGELRTFANELLAVVIFVEKATEGIVD